MIVLWTDAAVKKHTGTGIGWHIQTWSDGKGEVLQTVDKGSDFLSDNYTSVEGELLALTRGVKEVLSLGECEYLRIRIDCQPLVEKVNEREYITDDGKYIDALFRLLQFIDEWRVKWVERGKNSVADRQATVGLDQHI